MHLTNAQVVDAIIIAFLGVFALVGAARGALRGVLRIVAVLAAVSVGRFFAPFVEAPIGRALHWDPETTVTAVTTAVACVVLVALGIAMHRLDKSIDALRVPVLDTLLGLALGFACGALLAMGAVHLVHSMLKPRSTWAVAVEQSWTGAPAERLARRALALGREWIPAAGDEARAAERPPK